MIVNEVVDYKGTEIIVDDYRVDDPVFDLYKAQMEFFDWNSRDNEIMKRMKEGSKFKRVWLYNPEWKIMNYSRNEVVLSYQCDDYTDYKGSKIIHAKDVKDGANAIEVIEYVLNEHSNMLKNYIKKHQAFCHIPFMALESKKKRRIMNLQAGALHPQIPWREMWNIYVAEHRRYPKGLASLAFWGKG